jgi:hypothetical protein
MGAWDAQPLSMPVRLTDSPMARLLHLPEAERRMATPRVGLELMRIVTLATVMATSIAIALARAVVTVAELLGF